MPANAPESWGIFDGESRFDRGLRLSRAALRVVNEDRALRGLGALLAVTWAAVFGAYFALALRDLDSASEAALWALALVFPATFLGVFFGTATVAAAAGRVDGRPLTLRQALAVPAGRLRHVLLWSLFSAGVGWLINEVLGRIPGGGAVLAWLGGAAWGLVTMFAVPILVFEGCAGPACVRRSARLVRETWGEGVTGNVTLGALGVVVMIPAAVVLVIGAVLTASAPAIGWALVALAAVAFAGALVATTLARDVFALVLYRYAVDGTATAGFHPDDLARFATPRHSMFRRARRG